MSWIADRICTAAEDSEQHLNPETKKMFNLNNIPYIVHSFIALKFNVAI